MKRNRDPLCRCAQRVQAALAARASAQVRRVAERLDQLAESCRVLARHHHRLTLARRRGWTLCAQKLEPELFQDACFIRESAAELLQLQRADPPELPSLRAIIDDLRELQIEFDTACFDLKEAKIVVRTEPITLEGIELGRFSIELHLERLARGPDCGCFDCVALEPNPASNNDSVTHPHVSDDRLCAGEATGPIHSALPQGRLCDAFLLVAGVLRTYNASGPYVSLDEWEGATCPECSDTVRHRDDLYFCDDCDRDVCDGCMGRCDLCDSSCCHSCLERDPVSHRECCPGCRKVCSACDRTVDFDSFDEPAELCPECLAEAEQEESPPPPEEIVHEVNQSREFDNLSPLPAASALPAPGEVAAA